MEEKLLDIIKRYYNKIGLDLLFFRDMVLYKNKYKCKEINSPEGSLIAEAEYDLVLLGHITSNNKITKAPIQKVDAEYICGLRFAIRCIELGTGPFENTHLCRPEDYGHTWWVLKNKTRWKAKTLTYNLLTDYNSRDGLWTQI